MPIALPFTWFNREIKQELLRKTIITYNEKFIFIPRYWRHSLISCLENHSFCIPCFNWNKSKTKQKSSNLKLSTHNGIKLQSYNCMSNADNNPSNLLRTYFRQYSTDRTMVRFEFVTQLRLNLSQWRFQGSEISLQYAGNENTKRHQTAKYQWLCTARQSESMTRFFPSRKFPVREAHREIMSLTRSCLSHAERDFIAFHQMNQRTKYKPKGSSKISNASPFERPIFLAF